MKHGGFPKAVNPSRIRHFAYYIEVGSLLPGHTVYCGGAIQNYSL